MHAKQTTCTRLVAGRSASRGGARAPPPCTTMRMDVAWSSAHPCRHRHRRRLGLGLSCLLDPLCKLRQLAGEGGAAAAAGRRNAAVASPCRRRCSCRRLGHREDVVQLARLAPLLLAPSGGIVGFRGGWRHRGPLSFCDGRRCFPPLAARASPLSLSFALQTCVCHRRTVRSDAS
jgi:hypothetical protein